MYGDRGYPRAYGVGRRSLPAADRSPETSEAASPPADSSGRCWVSKEEVMAIVEGRDSGRLVCALGPEAYAGIGPSRYRRRGHIPRSVNLPARRLLDSSGRYRTATELASLVEPLLGGPGDASTPVVLYCGGGISAAVDALALSSLGWTDVAIYDGSLEEWAADPDLPLESGH